MSVSSRVTVWSAFFKIDRCTLLRKAGDAFWHHAALRPYVSGRSDMSPNSDAGELPKSQRGPADTPLMSTSSGVRSTTNLCVVNQHPQPEYP